MRPETSAVVSTYGSPESLVLVLRALARQSVLPAEVIVADDGSPADTLEAVREFGAEAPFRLLHVWQPHEGFRAARSRNNAIWRSRGEILAFLDQDTLPHRGWLEAHVTCSAPGIVCLGDLLPLDETHKAGLSAQAVATGAFEKWHAAREWKALRRRRRRCAVYVLLRRFGLGIKHKPRLKSGNFAARRDDLLRVNGFDEEYRGWGQEDDDLGRRLYACGVRPRALFTAALISHIPHPPRRPARWEDGANRQRFQRRRVPVRCLHGLAGHPHPDARATILRP